MMAGTPGNTCLPIALVAAVLCSAPALATDIPAPGPVHKAPTVVPFNWGGAYAGVHVGYGRGDAEFQWIPGPSFLDPNNFLPARVGAANTTLHPAGFLAGASAGYNVHSGSTVWGVEADIAYADLRRSRLVDLATLGLPAGNTVSESVAVSWLATLRPRIGIAADRSLIYLTGGLAAAGVEYRDRSGYAAVLPSTGSTSETRWGWTVGAGLELAGKDRWTIKAEYLYADLGRTDYSAASPSLPPADTMLTHRHHLALHVVRVSLSHFFGGRP